LQDVLVLQYLNLPFYHSNMSTENLQYLTSEQALADFANFIQQYSTQNPELAKVPWIAFGGSYSGSLAAWLKLKYPHLITGKPLKSCLSDVILVYDYHFFRKFLIQARLLPQHLCWSKLISSNIRMWSEIRLGHSVLNELRMRSVKCKSCLYIRWAGVN